jgi:hypothetical protein
VGLWRCAPIELVRGLLVGDTHNSSFRDPKPLLTDLVAVAVLAAWGATQGIYVFDLDVQRDIGNSAGRSSFSAPSVDGPHTGRGYFDEVTVRIAKV